MTPTLNGSTPETVLASEHDVQLRLLRLVESLLEGQTRTGELKAALEQLIDYTEVHFLSEQLLMRLYAYPQQRAHEQRHAEIMERLRAIGSEWEAGEAATASSIASSLREAIGNHIAGEDAALSKHIASIDGVSYLSV